MSGIEIIALSHLHHTSSDFLKMSEMLKNEKYNSEQSSETSCRQNISLKSEEIRQKSSYSIDDILRKRQTDDATIQTQVNSFFRCCYCCCCPICVVVVFAFAVKVVLLLLMLLLFLMLYCCWCYCCC